MFFSVYGASADFKITFRCEGAEIESNIIKVTTSVTKIKFSLQPEQSIDIEKDESLKPIVQILGDKG